MGEYAVANTSLTCWRPFCLGMASLSDGIQLKSEEIDNSKNHMQPEYRANQDESQRKRPPRRYFNLLRLAALLRGLFHHELYASVHKRKSGAVTRPIEDRVRGTKTAYIEAIHVKQPNKAHQPRKDSSMYACGLPNSTANTHSAETPAEKISRKGICHTGSPRMVADKNNPNWIPSSPFP